LTKDEILEAIKQMNVVELADMVKAHQGDRPQQDQRHQGRPRGHFPRTARGQRVGWVRSHRRQGRHREGRGWRDQRQAGRGRGRGRDQI